ncbi:type II toxin-antitoxin system HicA family toxin [bacterium]|nr:type II toxin-antitoxin system HicA family toxin [bacterium]
MCRITPTNWQTQVKVFEKFGCVFVRQKGDHLIYDHANARRPAVIPKYKEIPVTVIKTNMRTVGMKREDYFQILEEI